MDKNDCVVNYRLRWGRRTAKLYSSVRALRRGAAIGTSCCPWVVADSLSGTATSTHGGHSGGDGGQRVRYFVCTESGKWC